MSDPRSSRHSALDPVSFVFAQILSQVDYLFEGGYLSQENYSTIAAALVQSTPPPTPTGSYASYLQSDPISNEPNQYSSGYFPSPPSRPPPQPQIGAVSSSSSEPPSTSKKPSTPSLLNFRSRSSKGKARSQEPPLPTTPFEEAEEPQLGRINRGLRKTLQGGFVISQIVDQALALTPGVPEGLRESIVERVEEGSRDYVRKATDPRQQALWREEAQKVGSSAWKLARGGGGTSRASSQIYRDSPAGHVNAKTGEFSIISSSPASDGSSSSTSSIHSFFAGPNVNVTTVVTVSFLQPLLDEVPSRMVSVPTSSASESWTDRQYNSVTGSSREGDLRLPRDPSLISGRDW